MSVSRVLSAFRCSHFFFSEKLDLPSPLQNICLLLSTHPTQFVNNKTIQEFSSIDLFCGYILFIFSEAIPPSFLELLEFLLDFALFPTFLTWTYFLEHFPVVVVLNLQLEVSHLLGYI